MGVRVADFDIVGLAETWIKVKGWKKMKEKMRREFNWICLGAKRKEERKS